MADEESSQELNEDCSFVWDEASQLYFHARTGFYHDPNAGWYYSTKDGLYYKFEDGNYVPLNHDAVYVDERDGGGTREISMQDESHLHKGFDGEGICSLNEGVEVEGCQQEQTVVNEATPASGKRKVDSMAGRSADLPEEWSFIWDETLQLYFDARSGFYHDPNAGWYYSSRDGVYYKFQNGHYVPLKSDLVDKGDVGGTCVNSLQNESQSHTCHGMNNNYSSILRHESDACQQEETIADEASSDNEGAVHHASEDAQPPSEWLEDTLIELYLAGYSNQTIDAGGESGDAMTPPEACDRNDFRLSSPGTNDAYELEEGEWIPEDLPVPSVSNEDALNQALLQDEEKWQAQYGQVIQSREEPALEFPVVDLWDWEVVRGSGKDGKSQVVRLVGRLVKRSAKLHPSMPAGGGFLKTAPICQVRFDLQIGPGYKDRAAARRMLHHGYGVGPGQKNLPSRGDDVGSSGTSVSTEEAAAEALNMSFGAGSFARKVLESMGWKEGEGLGRTVKGSVEPVQAVGNVGSTGLGWPQSRTKRQ
ncbi:SUPPRESSOR OF ABI3-5 isoform X4 [Rhodamnia argentea]|uniref:SUPPRESSOR OF ABI3-5 isoform X4 n=1 Tax=Rhodamnia argentea TaxID=178133 RepID=A0ABM3HNX4_9MYRT|nr:SUPPRESSOR OF ABI3-5 isoform X4 [Rhodamnia argentea]